MRSSRLVIVSFAVVALLVEAAPARAQSAPAAARLVYSRAPEASACPDEETIRSGIAARLGYDPFRADAQLVVRAHVEAEAKGLVARVRTLAPDGSVRGERELTSPARDCAELAASLELAVAISVDPLVLTRPAAAAGQAAPVSPEPAPAPVVAEPEPPSAPESPPAEPLALEGGLGLVGAVGTTPKLTAGVLGGLALHSRSLGASIGLELRTDLPGNEPFRGGSVRAHPSFASLIPCLRAERFGGCAVFAVGVLSSSARDLPEAEEALTPFAGAGLRLQYDTRMTGPVHLRLQAEALGSFTRTTLFVGSEEAWTSPVGSASVGLVFLLAPSSER